MALTHHSLPLVRARAPKVQHFALLAGHEAAVRGVLISSMPLTVYTALGSAEATSAAYFVAHRFRAKELAMAIFNGTDGNDTLVGGAGSVDDALNGAGK